MHKKKWFFFFCGILLVVILFFTSMHHHQSNHENASQSIPDEQLLELSEQFLYHVRMEKTTEQIEEELATLEFDRLFEGLPSDASKNVFWINLYNAWFQVLASREKMKRPEIFTEKVIEVAKMKLSLDMIEHDILRRYRWKYGLGYIPRLFPGKMIRQLAVENPDERLHFALNCGAASCPPIAFYNYENLEDQLQMAASSFLTGDTEIDHAEKTVHLTKLFLWYRGDFGGRKGIRRILETYLEEDVQGYRIRYKPYDWEMQLGHFAENE